MPSRRLTFLNSLVCTCSLERQHQPGGLRDPSWDPKSEPFRAEAAEVFAKKGPKKGAKHVARRSVVSQNKKKVFRIPKLDYETVSANHFSLTPRALHFLRLHTYDLVAGDQSPGHNTTQYRDILPPSAFSGQYG